MPHYHQPTGFGAVCKKLNHLGCPYLYTTGFQGYDTLVRASEDIGPKHFTNDMLPKYFQAVVDESRRWAQNCGYAKAGESAIEIKAAM